MTAICISETYLTNYMLVPYTNVTNCVRYNSFSECLECAATFFLDLTSSNSATTPCIAACDLTTTKAIIIDNLDGRVNICVDASYIYPLNGYGIAATALANFGCNYIARVKITDPLLVMNYKLNGVTPYILGELAGL